MRRQQNWWRVVQLIILIPNLQPTNQLLSLSLSLRMYAVTKNAHPASGGYHDVQETVTRSASQHVRSDSDVKEFYIGIASNGEQGLANRFNAKYKDLGYDEITPLYTTSSDSFRKGMEEQLIDHLASHPKCSNAIGGGGGPVGSGDMSVYIAKKYYDSPPEREGPRGGSYYYNSAGSAVYGSSSDGVYTGPRGGQFYFTEHGNKVYL